MGDNLVVDLGRAWRVWQRLNGLTVWTRVQAPDKRHYTVPTLHRLRSPNPQQAIHQTATPGHLIGLAVCNRVQARQFIDLLYILGIFNANLYILYY